MMAKSAIRDRVISEVELIPEHKLSEIFDFIHYFRVGLQKSKGNFEQIMQFAGCWKDMPEDTFNNFLVEIRRRRKQAFSKRRSGEARTG
jgi:hypothetical protein